MNKALTFVTGLGAGSALMFMLDPDRGRRRRVLVRDRLVGTWNDTGDALRKTSRNLGNRAQGVAASTRSIFGERAQGRRLIERIRSRIGHVVSYPRAIEMWEEDGRVIVRGPILASEVGDFLRTVRAVKGVENVENRLDVHQSPESIPGFRLDDRMWQRGTTPAWKTMAGLAGSALAAYGLVARRRTGFGRTAGMRAFLRRTA
jgi:hypothetical protein